MRKWLVGLMMGLFLVGQTYAFDRVRNTGEAESIAATDANTNLALNDPCADLLVVNDGANEIFVDPFDGVAVANPDTNFQINNGESFELSNTSTKAVGIICDTGETATVRVFCLEYDN